MDGYAPLFIIIRTSIRPTGKAVYADFVPANGNLYLNNNSKPVYRSRPRYNSEYIYDIPSLVTVGATISMGCRYPITIQETWFFATLML